MMDSDGTAYLSIYICIFFKIVRNVSTWITAALRNEQFFSLAELNSAIREKLEQFNANTLQSIGTSLLPVQPEVVRHTWPVLLA